MKCFNISLALLAGICLATPPAGGDVVTMNDDTVYVGRIVRSGDDLKIITADGQTITVKFDDVARIEAGTGEPTSRPGNTGDDGVSADLASLRRSSASIDDLDRIISRYENFIERHPNDPEAAADLEMWQTRRDENFVKFQGKWMSPASRDDLISSVYERANFIRLAIKGGDIAAAEAQLAELDEIDPGGPAAAYFRGVLAERDGKIVEAEKHYQAVREAVPGHAPTLINLAALSVNRNKLDRALTFLLEAMQANPGNEPVLNAAAETFALLDRDRQNRTASRAAEVFDRQDRQLAAENQPRGRYRWGSDWITAEQWKQIQAKRDEVEARINELTGEYRSIQSRQETLRRTISANNTTMNQLIVQSRVVDAEGNLRQLPLPPTYYTLQDQNRQAEQELGRLDTDLQRLNQQAQQLRQGLPQPTFTGRITPVGEDGVPVLVPNGQQPATQPE